MFTDQKGIIVFFYVDDIAILYTQNRTQDAHILVSKLKKRYEMKDLGQLNWFIGVRIIRDRPNRRLWLSQDSYIEKMAITYGLRTPKPPHNPLSESARLEPYDGKATLADIRSYQAKIGSINYSALSLRPDIAKAGSLLASFMLNPAPAHHAAADQVIAYLYDTRHYAIMYDGEHKEKMEVQRGPPVVDIFADAAFANNSDRRSAHEYTIKLFEGLIN